MAILLDTSSLTKFGDMVSGGGIVAAVTSGDGGSTGYKQATTGYAGVTFATPTAVDSAEVASASNGFDASGGNTPITLKLFGKVGAAPTSPSGGVLLGTLGPFTDINATTTKTINSIDKDTEWDHVWVTGTTGVWTVYESVKIYTPDGPPPPSGQTATGSNVSEFYDESRTPLATSLSLTTGGCTGRESCNLLPKQVARIKIGPVESGDIVQFHAEAEFTNDNNYVCSVVSTITLTSDQNFGNSSEALFDQAGDLNASSQAYVIGRNNGPNVDKSIIHHSPHLRSGFVMVTPEMAAALNGADCWVVFWAWAVSSSAGGGAIISIGDSDLTKLGALKRRYS